VPARLLAALLLALLPSVSAAGPVADRSTPLEVAAAVTVCLQQGRVESYVLAGRTDRAELYEDDWLFGSISRREPGASDLSVVHDPIQPPIVLSFSDPAASRPPVYADEPYRRELARAAARCLSAVYPPS
jgi:hypothetical protein